MRRNVRLGSLADMTAPLTQVRFAPVRSTGQRTGPIADMPPTEFTFLSGCTLPSLIQAPDTRCSRRQRRLCG